MCIHLSSICIFTNISTNRVYTWQRALEDRIVKSSFKLEKIKYIHAYSIVWSSHCNPLQGQYRVEFTTQGKPCSHYREPLFSLQGPCIHHRESCIHYREFPVRITTQGNPCNHYREWVCSECSAVCSPTVIDSSHQNIERKGAKDRVMTKYTSQYWVSFNLSPSSSWAVRHLTS